MRYLIFALSLLIFVSSQVYAQQQYTEGACIMLQQQIDRFSNHKQNSNFRSATREYEKSCRNPVTYLPHQMNTNDKAVVVMPDTAKTTPAKITSDITKLKQPTEAITSKLAEPALVAMTAASEQSSSTSSKVIPDTATLNKLPLSNEQVDDGTIYTAAVVSSALMIQLINNIPLIAANIFALLLAVFLLTTWFGFNLPGFKGVFAEYKLNRLLRWRLSREYQHFRKLKLRTANDELVVVDHVVLCPYGIFVITVKGERGSISGTETQANWTRSYLGRKKHLMNPLHQNYKNVAAVKHLMQLQETAESKIVHSVAVFSRTAKFETAIAVNIAYIDTVSLYVKQFTEACLTDEQQERFAALLTQASTEC